MILWSWCILVSVRQTVQELGALYSESIAPTYSIGMSRGWVGGAKVAMSVEMCRSFNYSAAKSHKYRNNPDRVRACVWAVTIKRFECFPNEISVTLDRKVQRSFNSKQHTVLKLCYVVLHLLSISPVPVNFTHSRKLWKEIQKSMKVKEWLFSSLFILKIIFKKKPEFLCFSNRHVTVNIFYTKSELIFDPFRLP